MKLILSELYKLFIKRRFIVLLTLLLVFETVSFCVSLENRIELDADSVEVYKTYINEYSGELTDEKIMLIEAEIEERYFNESLKGELERQFSSNEITVEEYKSESAILKEKVKGTDGFNRFINAYYDALDNEQYLADSTVWDVLFGNGGIDFTMVIVIILMIIALTVYDEEIGINRLKFSAKNGKSQLISVQIGTSCLFSILIPSLIFAGRFFIAKMFFGLDGFENPLNTAEIFEFTQWNLSLLSAYVYLSIIKTSGCVYLALLTMIIGQVCKSSLYTMFLSLVSVYVPAYVLSTVWERYLVPIPSSLLTAVGYFSATEYGSLDVAENGEIIINTFSIEQLQVFFLVVLLTIIAMMITNRILWTKRQSFK